MEAVEMGLQGRWIHVLFRAGSTLSSTSCEPSDDEDDYIKEFRRKNLKAISIPFLKFHFKNSKELCEILKEAGTPQVNTRFGLIITSPRAVEAIDRALELLSSQEERENILSYFKQELVLVVGQMSGKKCHENLGLKCNEDSTKTGSAEALVMYIQNNFSSSYGSNIRFIYPKSSLSDDKIEKAFEKSSTIRVDSLEAYETKPEPSAVLSTFDMYLPSFNFERDISDQIILNLIFFSPSGLHTLLKINQEKLELRLCSILKSQKVVVKYTSIGKTTEAALLNNGFEVFCSSEKPNPTSLVESILKRAEQTDNQTCRIDQNSTE